MKYPDETYENMMREIFPTFLLLLCDRNLNRSIAASKYSEGEFVQAIEAFLFQIINIADPDAMEGRYDTEEYFKRRLEFLRSLGLDDYIQNAQLISTSSPLVGPN